MSPAPEETRRFHQPLPVTGSEQHAGVIEIRPWPANRSPAASGSPIVDHVGLDHALPRTHVNRRERYYSTPPPPRVRHRSWLLSSAVIAGGGVLAVLIAGELVDVPIVATVALLATVVCGAILVAAQLTEDVRRARSRRRRPEAPSRLIR